MVPSRPATACGPGLRACPTRAVAGRASVANYAAARIANFLNPRRWQLWSSATIELADLIALYYINPPFCTSESP